MSSVWKSTANRTAAALRCKEHLTLIDLLLSDQREAAADFTRLHLRDAAARNLLGQHCRTDARLKHCSDHIVEQQEDDGTIIASLAIIIAISIQAISIELNQKYKCLTLFFAFRPQ